MTTIGDNFLKDCWELPKLDLSSLGSVDTIGRGFLFGCKSLKTVDLGLEGLGKITTLPVDFLDDFYLKLDAQTRKAMKDLRGAIQMRSINIAKP